jgi:predicted RNase H-like HicB family nuclease
VDLTVFLEPCDEGGYHVWVPALPGCHSEGDTEDEALDNIREAIALYLSPEPAGPPIPPARALHLAV